MKKIILLVLMAVVTNILSAQENYKHSLDFCPLSPVIGIYAIHYNQRVTPKSELILSPSYMRIKYKDIGHTDAWGVIVGYRQYLWKNLHVDYQLMPMWDRFMDENENKKYQSGFDLWNEFRVGYRIDFNVSKTPMFVNVQWPLGFGLYYDSKAKPESWKQKNKKDPLFYFPPLFFVGVRF